MKKLLLTGVALVSMATQAQSWTPQGTKFPLNFGVDEIAIVDANTAWTFAYDGTGNGTYPKIISKTTNGGTTWTATTIVGGPGSNALISDIAAVDANTAWIITAGTGAAGTNPNRVWKTTNGGASWTHQTSAAFTTSSFGNQIYFWDANNGWACGDPIADGKFEMYKTSNGGTTWTAVAGRPASIGDFSYVALKEVVGDNIWIGTDIGRILHSTDRGATWTGNVSPVLDFGGVTTCGSSGSMAYKDGSNGLLITADNAATGPTCATPTPNNLTAGLYETNDGGATWVPIIPTGPWYFGDITYVPGTANTYVSTGINSGKPTFMGSSYSTDGGHTWIAIDATEQRGKVQFLNPTTGWAGQFSDSPSGTEGIMKFVGNLALGVSDNTMKSGLQAYPNPASDVVTIKAKNDIQAVTVIDLSGKKVKSFGNSTKIDVSSLAKGTYILQVFYVNGSIEQTKLIKK